MHDESTATSDTTEGVRRSLPSRRKLLLTAGALGVGGALGLGLAADRGDRRDRATITYAVARAGPDGDGLVPRTKAVPTAWVEQLERAFAIQEDLLASDLPSLVGSFVVPGNYDEPSASLAVDATDEAVAGTLQEVASDLDVELNVVDGIPPGDPDAPPVEEAYRLPDVDRRDVPGGVACSAAEAAGTLAPALFDRQTGDRLFGTSNHLYGAAGAKEREHAGEPLHLLGDDGQRRIGRVVRGYPLADLVRVAPADGARPVPAIARASPGRVIGQFTRAGLADLVARGGSLQKVGAFSGHTEGEVKGVDGVTCYVGEICKPGQLRWGDEGTMTDGDSGSVSFAPDPEHPDDYVLVGGINTARTWWPGMDFTWGTAAHHLLDAYGLHF